LPPTPVLGDDVRVETPETLYAWNGEDALAYQLVGEGPVDLVYLQGFGSNVIVNWEHPAFARFARELACFSRLIITDKRGLGRSERFTPRDIPPIETLWGHTDEGDGREHPRRLHARREVVAEIQSLTHVRCGRACLVH
jgi:pimeloyl-ACP methyl ester carboxylesterase